MTKSIAIITDLSNPADNYTALSTVGTVYSIGINGSGYMLAQPVPEDRELAYRRRTVPLDPDRLATTATPFSEAIERYSFISYSDYSAGAGQTRLDRETSLGNRYLDSDGVNPFTPDQLTLLNSVDRYTSAYTSLRGVVVGTRLFVQTAAAVLSYFDTVAAFEAGTPTGTVTLPGSPTIEDLTTDGQYWYAACGTAGIFRGTTTAPASAWSASQAFVVDWAADRVCAVLKSGTSTTPNQFITLAEAGTVEATLLTLDEGFTITNFTGGSGYTYFGVYAGSEGVIYKWNNDTAVTPSVALDQIAGNAPRRVIWYQGQVVARYERRKSTTVAEATIYRCPVSTTDGTLTPFLVARLSGSSTDHGPGAFGVDDRYVYFTYKDMDSTGNDGVGVIDLSTGGYAKSYKGGVGGSTAQVRSIFLWQNRVGFCLDGLGVYVQDPDAYVTTGTLTTSISDKASSLDKVFDFITMNTKALITSENVSLEWTTDGLSYLSVTDGTFDTVGGIRKVVTFNKKGTGLGLRITLNGPGTSTPALTLVQVRLHPHGLADTLVQLPINCNDILQDLQSGVLEDSSHGFPGSGAARARVLESLAQSRILFQDIDYQRTTTAEVYEVVGVEVMSRQVFDPAAGQAAFGQVALTTLRRAAK